MEISFERLLALFFNKLKFILLVAVLATVATYFISDNLIEKKYTSTSQMSVPTITTETTATGDIINTRRLVTEYIDILNSLDFFGVVAEAVEEKTGIIYSNLQIKENTKIISKSTDEDSSVFYITYTDKSAENAEAVLGIIDETAITYIADRYEGQNKEGVTRKLGVIIVNEKPNGHMKPSSPNTRDNCLYAFIIAFVLSGCFFYFREIFDNRIKNVQDIVSEYNVSLLGVIPDYIQRDTKKSGRTYNTYSRSYSDNTSKEETK